MPGARRGGMRLTCLVVLSALALLPGLGSSGRLTYHEAFVARGAKILDSGRPGLSDDRRLAMAREASLTLVAGRRLGVLRGRRERDGGTASFGFRRHRAGPGSRRVGHAPSRTGHRPLGRFRSGDHGLDRHARPTGRGRYSAGMLDYLGHRRL